MKITICIHSEGSNGCLPNPCDDNNTVFLSMCRQSIQDNEKVDLEVKETENGTIVSIFCKMSVNCVGSISEVMVLNIALCKFMIYVHRYYITVPYYALCVMGMNTIMQ